MDNKPSIVNHKLCLYSMSFLLSRIVCFPFPIILRSWNLLFCGIYKSKKAWKVLFNFINCLEPFCNVVYLLRYRHALSNQPFYFLYVSANITLIDVKEKVSQSVSYVKTIVH